MSLSPFFDTDQVHWPNGNFNNARPYLCGFCGHKVSSIRGFPLVFVNGGKSAEYGIYICPHCFSPTFFTSKQTQIPGPSIGSSVNNVPPELNALYEEARKSTT